MYESIAHVHRIRRIEKSGSVKFEDEIYGNDIRVQSFQTWNGGFRNNILQSGAYQPLITGLESENAR